MWWVNLGGKSRAALMGGKQGGWFENNLGDGGRDLSNGSSLNPETTVRYTTGGEGKEGVLEYPLDAAPSLWWSVDS